jgi:glucokinase
LPLLAAIDVGGTKTLVELFDAHSQRVDSAVEFPTPRDGDVVETLASAVETLRDGRRLGALAVACPGPLDKSSGVLMDPPNLSRNWWQLPLARSLVEKLGCAVALENDANLGALGESTFGAARGFSSALYLTVSTGVGAGFVVGQKIFGGGRGFGLEVGHTTISAGASVRCACGRESCVEALASGSAIARRAVDVGWARDEPSASARSVAAAANSGDLVAHQLLKEAAEYLAQGIVNFVYVLDPSVVLIGGGVAQSELFVELVNEAIASEKVMNPFRDVPVRRAALGSSSVITGAKVLATQTDSRVTPSA